MRFRTIFQWPHQYRALRGSNQDELVHDSLDDGEANQCSSIVTIEPKRRVFHTICLVWLNLAWFIMSTTMLIFSLAPPQPLYDDRVPERPRNFELKHVSMPSPLLDEVDIRISPRRMDATLLNTKPPAIYRREPSRDVDLAWELLYDTRPIALTRAQVEAMGKDPASAVRIPASWGRGNDSYFGRVDAFHQLHCLDALRREARFDHYYADRYPGGFNTTGGLHQLHLTHCAWLLAQNIMCAASTDVYTHVWTDTLEHPFPDFQIQHQCKDYDAILAWQRENALDEREFVALRRPENYPFRVMTHEFKDIHGWFNTHEDDGDFESGELV